MTINTATLPALIVVLVLGTAAFTTLGIGIARLIPNSEAAPVIVNLTILPLTFISGIWFPTNGMPSLVQHVAKLFPVRSLADGLQHVFDPRTVGSGFNAHDIQSLVIWTAVGIFLMFRVLRRPQGEVA